MTPPADFDQRNSEQACTDLIAKLIEAQAYEEAWSASQSALAEHPASPELLVSAAAALMKLDRAAQAEQYGAKAVALRPGSPVAWNNLGLALRNQNRVPESLRCFEKALQLNPAWARAHYDRAFALLLLGDYPLGFEEYEHRWQANELERPGDSEPVMQERLWRGEDLHGKRILLYAEQGLGDTIQFVRYAALLEARGAVVILEVQPRLRRLLRWLGPACEVGSGGGLAPFDVHCPLMSLPLLLETTLESIPGPAAFSIPEAIHARWKAKIPSENRLNVGFVWAGNPENPMDDRRSTDLLTFEPIFRDPFFKERSRFYSFQVGSRQAEIEDARFSGSIHDLSSELNDATETAASLLRMHLVITVDTFVAHLAATLGVTVWLLLPFAPDWRWLLDREDSPWYPSVRLFRQGSAGDWVDIAARVRDALHELINSQSCE